MYDVFAMMYCYSYKMFFQLSLMQPLCANASYPKMTLRKYSLHLPQNEKEQEKE